MYKLLLSSLILLIAQGLRAQMEINRSFTIYGPPGTGEFIEGLLTAMAPAVHAGFGLQGQSWQSRPVVHEVRDGAEFQIDGVNVTLVENSHYQSGTKTVMEPGSVSLSFRFDSPARSIVYTGDTGPSTAVTRLSANADLLVIEMMDGPVVLDNIRRFNPDIDNEILKGLTQHFALHHLSPEQVARLATAARVGKIVVTHFMPGANTAEQAAYYRVLMQQYYDGEITFAQDLERY